MLLLKALGAYFVLADGHRVKPGKNLGMFHDASGGMWPRSSFLFAPFSERPATPHSMSVDEEDYLGSDYQAHVGTIDLPPRGLNGWQEVGLVEKIFYDRTGNRFPDFFVHRFKAPSWREGALLGAMAGGLLGMALGGIWKEVGRGGAIGGVLGAALGAAAAKVAFPFDPPAKLFRYGSYYRLELPKAMIANGRGFIIP